jgi:hypothetical protein
MSDDRAAEAIRCHYAGRRAMSRSATIQSYQRLRNAGRALHGKILRGIPRSIIVSTARELGLWRKGILVADEDDTDVMADRMIYDKRWAGKSALGHFEEELPKSAWTDDERRFGHAMKTAYVSLFEILDTLPGSHVVLVDRLADVRSGEVDRRIEMVDLGLSETAVPGALLAARLLDAGDFSMSTGAGLPFAAPREAVILKYLREKEPGFRKKRVDMPEDYSLYFYRLHRKFGIGVRYDEAGAD